MISTVEINNATKWEKFACRGAGAGPDGTRVGRDGPSVGRDGPSVGPRGGSGTAYLKPRASARDTKVHWTRTVPHWTRTVPYRTSLVLASY